VLRLTDPIHRQVNEVRKHPVIGGFDAQFTDATRWRSGSGRRGGRILRGLHV